MAKQRTAHIKGGRKARFPYTLFSIPDTRSRRGFTLVEMLVAVALFSVVMLTAGVTLVSLVYANRKAQAIQSTMNNLNIALDGMVRSIRSGSNYRCGSQTTSPGDCARGGTVIYFTPFGGDPKKLNQDWAYIYNPSTGVISKTTDGNINDAIPIIAPEVTIASMTFYVVGTAPESLGDTLQPKVVITLRGTAGVQGATTRTNFNIQATAVQRVLDI